MFIEGAMVQDYVTVPCPPHGWREIDETFGKIVYDEGLAGSVIILNNWAKENITKACLPIVGNILIHKKMKPIFMQTLWDILQAGLEDEIKQFYVWCPRHKMHDKNRGLSTHSWAIACDINQAENPVGYASKIHPEVVEIFKFHKFSWGGDWFYKDAMHFQYCSGF